MKSVSVYPVQSMSDARRMGLPQFADSFNHRIEAAFPILAVFIDGKLRGYGQMERRWIITPAIHPSLNSPRDTYRIAKSSIELLNQIAPGFLMQVPRSKDQIFTEPLMKKLGMKPWGFRLFSAK